MASNDVVTFALGIENTTDSDIRAFIEVGLEYVKAITAYNSIDWEGFYERIYR